MSADSIKNDLETAATWLVQMSRQGNWTNERRDNCEALAQRLRALPSAELERDAARLDWLEMASWGNDEECRNFVDSWETPDGIRHPGGLRDAIDAARANEAKR